MKRDLPRRVYLRHGAFYFVTPAGKWIRLAAERDGLPAMYRALADLAEQDTTTQRMPAVIGRWLKSKRGKWAPKTIDDQERRAAVMGEAFAEFSPAQVTAPVCAAYLATFEVTPRTYNMHRTMLRQVLAFAALEGLREGHNPVDDVPAKALRGRKRVVTDAEIERLKAAALQFQNGQVLVQMIDLALITGQRIGDLLKMRWQDVTDEGLLVQQSKTGERLLIEWTPALRAAVEACAAGREKIGHLLRSRLGRAYTYKGIQTAWDQACARAGITDLHIHDLRGRAGVDALLAAGEDMRAAQRLLGHRGEAMTRHYVDGKYHRRAKPSR
ncbi:tyrosine-type recombinase/integrase [Caldimonas tepidiphila]|uniref:tyrosine-type recombinase/integrase n=1 Tax=Caldimonas tepidiphila TaxID=2315841 RepID=UPI000E5B3EC5|nr:tyrosine-type recombinase/integrase [Caldimonas tepidiphila]